MRAPAVHGRRSQDPRAPGIPSRTHARACAGTLAVLALAAGSPRAAEPGDRIEITRKSFGLRPPGEPEPAPVPPIVIDGAALRELAGKVDAAIRALGGKTQWTDFGPDAEFVRIEIVRGGTRVRLDSWRPLVRDDPKLAASERGLVAVESAEEKRRIESEGSPTYRALAELVDALPVPPAPSRRGAGD